MAIVANDIIAFCGFGVFHSSTAVGDFPDPANVLESDTTDGVPGTYHEPTVGEVQKGVTFGPASAYTGTYNKVRRRYQGYHWRPTS